MRIIVTGSAGFIGSHLVSELVKDHFVTPIDRANVTGWDLKLGAPDVRGYDAVIHLAAQVGRVFGEDDLLSTVMDNAGVTALIAQACGEANVRLLYASTSEIYGDGGDKNWNEDHFAVSDDYRSHAYLPHNLYGLSKRWGEEVCRLYAPKDLTIMRFSMPYGPGLPAGRGRAAIINFLYDALWDRPLHVHKHSERSWCWIKDTIAGVRLLLEEGHSGAFNIGRDDNAVSMKTVAEMACDLVGASRDLIEMVDPPERQTVVKRLSTEKIRGLGWRPTVDLQEGMARTLEFVRTLPAPDLVAA